MHLKIVAHEICFISVVRFEDNEHKTRLIRGLKIAVLLVPMPDRANENNKNNGVLQCDDHQKLQVQIFNRSKSDRIGQKLIAAIWRSIDLVFNNENRKYWPSSDEHIEQVSSWSTHGSHTAIVLRISFEASWIRFNSIQRLIRDWETWRSHYT